MCTIVCSMKMLIGLVMFSESYDKIKRENWYYSPRRNNGGLHYTKEDEKRDMLPVISGTGDFSVRIFFRIICPAR